MLSALSHPVREHRMIAIEVIGRPGSGEAVLAPEKIIVTDNDHDIIREAVRALDRIGGPQAGTMIASLARHPPPLVRKIARDFVQYNAALCTRDDPGKSR